MDTSQHTRGLEAESDAFTASSDDSATVTHTDSPLDEVPSVPLKPTKLRRAETDPYGGYPQQRANPPAQIKFRYATVLQAYRRLSMPLQSPFHTMIYFFLILSECRDSTCIHAEQFREAVKRYQLTSDNPKVKTLDLDKKHTWDEVIRLVKDNENAYKDAARNPFRRLGRTLGSQAG